MFRVCHSGLRVARTQQQRRIQVRQHPFTGIGSICVYFSTLVHPTAVVSPEAQVHPTAKVGPYCVIGAGVVVGPRCLIHPYVYLVGDTRLESDCEIFPYSAIGTDPQDKKFDKGSQSSVRIGSKVVVREHCTINGGTQGGGGETTVLDGTWILKSSHVGHDCHVGRDVVLSNCVHLAGHVRIGDGAVLGGLTGVRQFVHIGRVAMVGGCSAVDRHVPPFATVIGNRARVIGTNIIGLKRAGISKEEIRELAKFAKQLNQSYQGDNIENTYPVPTNDLEKEVLQFIVAKRKHSNIGICT